MSATGWTCYHCAEYFPATVEGRAAARSHFGPTPAHQAECLDRRTTAHTDAVRRMREAEAEVRALRVQVDALDEALDHVREHVDSTLARVNCDSITSAAQQLLVLRERLRAADVFSMVVHRLRPSVWSVAMVDAYGPGEHSPPTMTEAMPGPPSTLVSIDIVLDRAGLSSSRASLLARLSKRIGL